MFRVEQIITATQLIRSFREVSKFLAEKPQPLLISQKSGRFLVVLPAELFQFFVLDNAERSQPGRGNETVRDYMLSKN